MAGELEKLLRDAGLAQDQITKTLEAFDPKGLEAAERGVMRQSDYSRAQDRLKAERDEIQRKWDVANAEYMRMQTDYEATTAEKEAAAKKLAEAEDKLKNVPAAIDPAKFISKEDADKRFNDFAMNSTAYFSDALDIGREHRKLFGEELSYTELFQKATEAKKVPREYWAEAYKVQDKRTEIAAKEARDREDAIRKEEREKTIADMAKTPESRPFGSSKSPFYEPQDDKTTPWDSTGPTEAENTLVAELFKVGR